MIQPDRATSSVIHAFPTRSAADGPGVAAAGADTFVVTHLGGKEVVARMRADADVQPGQTMPFAFNLEKAVLFDPATVRDTATFDEPRRLPEGIPHVFVGGVPVVRDGRRTGALPGRALRRGPDGTVG